MRLRRTKLYLPGNNPNMLLRGHLFEPDGVILDLEDAVALSEKDTARILIQQVLKRGEFGNCEVTVRINGMDTDLWRQDIEAVVPFGVHGVRVPKVEDPKEMQLLDEALSEIEDKAGIAQGSTLVFCLLETALGIHRAYDIATSTKRIAGICPAGKTLQQISIPAALTVEWSLWAPGAWWFSQPTLRESALWTRSSPGSATKRGSGKRRSSSNSWALKARA